MRGARKGTSQSTLGCSYGALDPNNITDHNSTSMGAPGGSAELVHLSYHTQHANTSHINIFLTP
jgi:hypothetical protein